MQIAVKSKPHYSEKGFDTHVAIAEQRLFGVFDGMGVSQESAFASSAAASMLTEIGTCSYYEHLVDYLHAAKRLISERAPHGGTTATVVYVDLGGYLHYAHVGDSRLYVLHNGRVKQITSDEGSGNILYNYLGYHGIGVAQCGIVYNWDAFMLCTDGITGDWQEQLLSDKDIEDVLIRDDGLEDRAQVILDMSRKNDDKTLILVQK